MPRVARATSTVSLLALLLIAPGVSAQLEPPPPMPSASAPGGAAPGGGAADHLAALKESLLQSKQRLRSYQWVETTTIAMNGEVKSWKEANCYYGADGTLQKIPLASSPPPPQKHGLRGAIQKSKQEEIQNDIKAAVQLVHAYVPPDPVLLEQCRATGRLSVGILVPGQVVRLACRDYRQPGDTLGLTVNIATNRLTGIDVASYVAQASSPVTLNTRMGTLMDGTVYPASTTLGLASEQLTVTVANAGYRTMAQ